MPRKVQLAAGYDVWMGNVRGNRFSRLHESLDPDADEAFWRYSWQHHAAIDLPASLEYVAHATGQASFAYVGYSQGTTMALAALSSEPLVRARISHAALLAPVAFTAHMRSPLFGLMAYLRVEQVSGRLEIGGVLTRSALQGGAGTTQRVHIAMHAGRRMPHARCVMWEGLGMHAVMNMHISSVRSAPLASNGTLKMHRLLWRVAAACNVQAFTTHAPMHGVDAAVQAHARL